MWIISVKGNGEFVDIKSFLNDLEICVSNLKKSRKNSTYVSLLAALIYYFNTHDFFPHQKHLGSIKLILTRLNDADNSDPETKFLMRLTLNDFNWKHWIIKVCVV